MDESDTHIICLKIHIFFLSRENYRINHDQNLISLLRDLLQQHILILSLLFQNLFCFLTFEKKMMTLPHFDFPVILIH